MSRDWAKGLGGVPIQFWVCPIREHGERKDARGWPVGTVEWRGGVAHCTAPDCGRTSVDPTADPCPCGLDGETSACIDGAVYGPCEHENCGGVCEYQRDCDHECHNPPTHLREKAA